MSDPEHKTTITIVDRDLTPSITPMGMHPLVQAAMSGGSLDPATLRELLAVQRDWEAGEAKRAFTRALVALKRDLPTVIGRDTIVDFQTSKGRTSYRHASLAAAMGAITPALTQHGFSLAWEPRTEGNQVHVTARLTHSAGHSETATISAPVDTSGSKSPAQGVASTITLLQRYSALSLLGIATADMVDPPPRGSEDANAVNTARNIKAVAALRKYGKTKEEAEEYLGMRFSEWTNSDLERLREWLAPKREPGEEG